MWWDLSLVHFLLSLLGSNVEITFAATSLWLHRSDFVLLVALLDSYSKVNEHVQYLCSGSATSQHCKFEPLPNFSCKSKMPPKPKNKTSHPTKSSAISSSTLTSSNRRVSSCGETRSGTGFNLPRLPLRRLLRFRQACVARGIPSWVLWFPSQSRGASHSAFGSHPPPSQQTDACDKRVVLFLTCSLEEDSNIFAIWI